MGIILSTIAAYAAGKTLDSAVEKFNEAGGVDGLKQKATDVKAHLSNRGQQIVSAVVEKDITAGAKAASDIGNDIGSMASGTTKVVRKTFTEIAARSVTAVSGIEPAAHSFLDGIGKRVEEIRKKAPKNDNKK